MVLSKSGRMVGGSEKDTSLIRWVPSGSGERILSNAAGRDERNVSGKLQAAGKRCRF